MAELVKYELEDGTEVYFESAESDLVSLRGGGADVAEGGKLEGRLHAVAAAAEEVSSALRDRLAPHEVTLEFGVKVSGQVNWWFFAKNAGEASIKATLKWGSAAGSGAVVNTETEVRDAGNTEPEGGDTENAASG